ncbi:MAG TPA: hypothetical protein VK449_10695 [Anaerolineales bacterium]|nr:hypothetical protein [Anaerolineales bacterium]
MPVSAPSQPLGIRPDIHLSAEQTEMVRFLDGYDLWFVKERLLRKDRMPAERLDRAVLEFRRYMSLIGLGYRGLGMLSPEVDDVWHDFILFTREYAEFCQTAFGTFIHHVPRTSRTPRTDAGREAFLTAYTEVFGVAAVEAYAVATGFERSMGDEPSGCGTEDCTGG